MKVKRSSLVKLQQDPDKKLKAFHSSIRCYFRDFVSIELLLEQICQDYEDLKNPISHNYVEFFLEKRIEEIECSKNELDV